MQSFLVHSSWQVSQLETHKLILFFDLQEVSLMNQPWPEVDQDYPLPLRYFVSYLVLSRFYVFGELIVMITCTRVTHKYGIKVKNIYCRPWWVLDSACGMSRMVDKCNENFSKFVMFVKKCVVMVVVVMKYSTLKWFDHLEITWQDDTHRQSYCLGSSLLWNGRPDLNNLKDGQ